ncbi:phosphatase 1L-like protein [Euroglyphus maynei]|uniref:Phosphatase 1L-like protein n=1 Tax=Euroglyphus maynei TaxID=6958 RepID=A0A1Y3B291_EURMA|nr:phosphatase 1L-like protein [Euroglyphus maynei]
MTTMKTILNDEIISVDKRLVETFQRRSDISGSTALIAIRLFHSNKLLVANVGDSRGVLCDSKGATIPLSFDHKPYQLKEYRRILEAGGYISLKGVYRVNGILAISRALGDYPLKDNRLIIPDPDILSFDLKELKPKFMIMATDGFWDTFSNENAVQFVNNELSRYKSNESNDVSSIALEIAKKLAKESYNRESYDNITVIVVLFDENNIYSKASSSMKSSPTKKTCSSNEFSSKNQQQQSSPLKPAIHEECSSPSS